MVVATGHGEGTRGMSGVWLWYMSHVNMFILNPKQARMLFFHNHSVNNDLLLWNMLQYTKPVVCFFSGPLA